MGYDLPVVGKYYGSGGGNAVLVLSVLEPQDNEPLIICLSYSCSHQLYNLDTFTKTAFDEWFSANVLHDYEFDDKYYKGLTSWM